MTWKHICPKGLGQKLGSEADPKHRTVAVSQFSKQPAFLGQKRIFICFIGAHWTAHHNQSVHLIGVRNAGPLIKTPDSITRRTLGASWTPTAAGQWRKLTGHM